MRGTARPHVNASSYAATNVDMRVRPVDYLRLLEGGNFIHFVATVIADDDTSGVGTFNFRLKVKTSLAWHS